MFLPTSVDDNVVTCHSAEHPCGASALRGLGRIIYGRRLGTVEAVFANTTRMLGLNHFTLRGKCKVNTQWLLFCLAHNIGKIHRYAPGWG